MKNLELTKIVRKVIRNHKSTKHAFIHTNKYEKCRTVKIDVDGNKRKLQAKIDAALREAGSTNHSIKVLVHKPGWSSSYTLYSLIVRLPL